MNGTNGNEPGYPENALVPYPVIVAATNQAPVYLKRCEMLFSHFHILHPESRAWW